MIVNWVMCMQKERGGSWIDMYNGKREGCFGASSEFSFAPQNQDLKTHQQTNRKDPFTFLVINN